MTEEVLVDSSDGILTITINRPQRLVEHTAELQLLTNLEYMLLRQKK
ncbi:hypothetical protein [Variovorax paradoxus]